ncbi:MAG: YchJ family metal-binding protein [Cycloclasticus sp.]
MNKVNCPCGSLRPYDDCCGLFISKGLSPKTAEQLMRSRFSAFYLAKFQYIVDTEHVSKRHNTDISELKKDQSGITWIQLIIHRTAGGSQEDTDGMVEFSAFFNENNQFYELRETSQFANENGTWFYLDGKSAIQAINLTFKRNSPCWCRSGKKYKKCHAMM